MKRKTFAVFLALMILGEAKEIFAHSPSPDDDSPEEAVEAREDVSPASDVTPAVTFDSVTLPVIPQALDPVHIPPPPTLKSTFEGAIDADEARVRNLLGELVTLNGRADIGRLELMGYLKAHRFTSFAGMGLAFASKEARRGDPPVLGHPGILLYEPTLKNGLIDNGDPTDGNGDFPYRFIGWGYGYDYNPQQIPDFAGFPADAWLVHEAGFHRLSDGGFSPSPPPNDFPRGSKVITEEPGFLDVEIWHERLWDIHFFTDPDGGAARAAIHDPNRDIPGFSNGEESFFYPEIPFTGAPLPASRVEMEKFDFGKDFGWKDATPENSGGVCRLTGVDIAASTDITGGFDVVEPLFGEFLRYTVNVPVSGVYVFGLRLANGRVGGVYHVEIDGVNVSGPLGLPVTDSQSKVYAVVTPFEVNLTAGSHAVRIAFGAPPQGAGTPPAFNYFELLSNAPPSARLPPVNINPALKLPIQKIIRPNPLR